MNKDIKKSLDLESEASQNTETGNIETLKTNPNNLEPLHPEIEDILNETSDQCSSTIDFEKLSEEANGAIIPVYDGAKLILHPYEHGLSNRNKKYFERFKEDWQWLSKLITSNRAHDFGVKDIENFWFENLNDKQKKVVLKEFVKKLDSFLRHLNYKLSPEVREYVDKGKISELWNKGFYIKPDDQDSYSLWSETYFVCKILHAIHTISRQSDREFLDRLANHLSSKLKSIMVEEEEDRYILNPDKEGKYRDGFSVYIKGLSVSAPKSENRMIRKYVAREYQDLAMMLDKIRFKILLTKKGDKWKDTGTIIGILFQVFGSDIRKSSTHVTFAGESQNPSSTGKHSACHLVLNYRNEILSSNTSLAIKTINSPLEAEGIKEFLEKIIGKKLLTLQLSDNLQVTRDNAQERYVNYSEFSIEKEDISDLSIEITSYLRKKLTEVGVDPQEIIHTFIDNNTINLAFPDSVLEELDIISFLNLLSKKFKCNLSLQNEQTEHLACNYSYQINIPVIHSKTNHDIITKYMENDLLLELKQQYDQIFHCDYHTGPQSVEISASDLPVEIHIVNPVLTEEEEEKDHEDYVRKQNLDMLKKFLIGKTYDKYLENLLHVFINMRGKLVNEYNYGYQYKIMDRLANTIFSALFKTEGGKQISYKPGDKPNEIILDLYLLLSEGKVKLKNDKFLSQIFNRKNKSDINLLYFVYYMKHETYKGTNKKRFTPEQISQAIAVILYYLSDKRQIRQKKLLLNNLQKGKTHKIKPNSMFSLVESIINSSKRGAKMRNLFNKHYGIKYYK